MNLLDKVISYISPQKGAERVAYRNAIASYQGAAGGYGGAVPTRLSKSWTLSGQPAALWTLRDSDLIAMRDRARSLERNNAIADGILTRCVDNVIADGLKLQINSGNPDWDRRAEALFERWTKTADISGLPWGEHQQLAFRSYMRDGDAGCVLLQDGYVQIVEGDLIATPDKSDSTDVVSGVKLGAGGRHLGYYINTYDADGKDTSEFIDAKDFIFLARLKRASQVRGETAFAQTFELYDQLDKWIEAQLAAARAAACLSIFVKKNNAKAALGGLGTSTTSDGQTQRQLSLAPGSIGFLETDEDVVTVNPSQPHQSFPDNMAMMMRFLGLPLGLPLELSLLDFSRTSYNSARAALQQSYRTMHRMQRYFAERYLARIYRWRMSKFIKAGEIEDQENYFNCRFIAKPWAALDPLKEAQATQLNIDTGVETLSSVIQAQGGDFRDWVALRSAELEAMEAAGIPVYHHSVSVPIDQQTQPTAQPASVDPYPTDLQGDE